MIPALVLSFSAHAGNPFERTPKQVSTQCEAYLENFEKSTQILVSDTSKATYNTVFETFDSNMVTFLDDLLLDYLTQNAHTEKDVRDASIACTLNGFAALNALNANRDLYDRMTQVSLSGLSDEQVYTVNYWKAQFEVSGIGRDKATRDKVKALNDQISKVGNNFSQNINAAVKSIKVKAERLDGLPQDYLESHPTDENGMVTITTAYSDTTPIGKYGHDRELRKQVNLMSRTRAAEENPPILLDLLEKRYQLSQLLGHENYAVTNMFGTMVETPSNVVQFTGRLSNAIEAPMEKEKSRLLAQMHKIDPSVKKLRSWDASYLANIEREKEYELNAKEVRDYFDYNKVRDGIISLSEDLFGLEIRESHMPIWHDSVEPYDVFENDEKIGSFYLDSHPREGKFTHAAQFGLQMGKRGHSLPKAALLMNFPNSLMEHGQVETFLHEYGHLLHFIFAGQNDIGYSRFQGESDFGEAPSTMLEEWVWDYDTLKRFATNAKGDIIPKSLVKKMNKARYFGQALGVAGQLTYTALSFDLYNQNPKGLDLDAFEKNIFEAYSPYGYDAGTRMHASFGHLNGYGAKYYTYQWSNSIAEELLSRFKKEGLRNKKTAKAYREIVLARTGTKPAAELVKEFLGRDFSVDAYAKKLGQGG